MGSGAGSRNRVGPSNTNAPSENKHLLCGPFARNRVTGGKLGWSDEATRRTGVGTVASRWTRPPEIRAILLEPEALAARVQELAEEIGRDYRGRPLHLVGVLRGAVPFLVDLARALPLHEVSLDFLGISSYGQETVTSGVVRFTKDLDDPIAGRHVLIVEDIVDTGLTLWYLREHLGRRQPASLAVASLLHKPTRRQVPVVAEYLGFAIDDHFVVGYGLDKGGRFRHLPYVGIVDP